MESLPSLQKWDVRHRCGN